MSGTSTPQPPVGDASSRSSDAATDLGGSAPDPLGRGLLGDEYDTVRIDGVRATGTHGVLDFEHHEPQPFEVDVTLRVDVTDAARTDDLEHTVSYAGVAEIATRIVEGPHVDLIETLAARIAQALLGAFATRVEQVQVTVHKPEAPVGLPFGDVAVTVTRSDERAAVVALGANLGNPVETLARAVQQLRALPRTVVTAVSPLVETDPVGGPEQPVYLNAVALLHTTLRPATLLRALHAIEARYGRRRDVRWGARTLDLDLVQYGDPALDTDVVSKRPDLTLPHPRAHERAFVLAPWLATDHHATLRLPATEPGDALPVRTGAAARRLGGPATTSSAKGEVRRVADLLRDLAGEPDVVDSSGSSHGRESTDSAQAITWPKGVRVGPAWPTLP